MMTTQKKTEANNAPCACYCPRCHHQTRFQQAMSDKCWVCQKCLRFRVANPEEVKANRPQQA